MDKVRDCGTACGDMANDGICNGIRLDVATDEDGSVLLVLDRGTAYVDIMRLSIEQASKLGQTLLYACQQTDAATSDEEG